jgi:hypothetical protein
VPSPSGVELLRVSQLLPLPAGAFGESFSMLVIAFPLMDTLVLTGEQSQQRDTEKLDAAGLLIDIKAMGNRALTPHKTL